MIGGMVTGLFLSPGCGGDKDCTSDTGILELSIELADDYPESFQDNFDGQMKLWIHHLDEEPETSANCTQFSSESVLVMDHSLDLDQEFEVPSGWICAGTYGGYTTGGDEEAIFHCYGYLSPVEVSGCDHVDAPIIVTCEEEQYEGV